MLVFSGPRLELWEVLSAGEPFIRHGMGYSMVECFVFRPDGSKSVRLRGESSILCESVSHLMGQLAWWWASPVSPSLFLGPNAGKGTGPSGEYWSLDTFWRLPSHSPERESLPYGFSLRAALMHF